MSFFTLRRNRLRFVHQVISFQNILEIASGGWGLETSFFFFFLKIYFSNNGISQPEMFELTTPYYFLFFMGMKRSMVKRYRNITNAFCARGRCGGCWWKWIRAVGRDRVDCHDIEKPLGSTVATTSIPLESQRATWWNGNSNTSSVSTSSAVI